MKQIVILDGYTENPGDLTWEGFEALGEVSVYDRTPAEQVVSRIGEAEIVIVNKTPITRENLNACPKLRYIGVLATGYNVIDVEAAKEKGIVVTNIPTYGTTAVAQFVFALLLEICHHAALHSEAVKKGEWQTCPDFCFWKRPLIELAGKKLGIDRGLFRKNNQTVNIDAVDIFFFQDMAHTVNVRFILKQGIIKTGLVFIYNICPILILLCAVDLAVHRLGFYHHDPKFTDRSEG